MRWLLVCGSKRLVTTVSASAFLAAAICATASPVAQAQPLSITMTASQNSIAVGESLELRIEAKAHGVTISRVDPPALDDFNVVARRISRPMQFSFGGRGQQVTSSYIVELTLVPTREGAIKIAPATAQAGNSEASSDSLKIVVTTESQKQAVNPSTAKSDSTFDPKAFVRTTVSQDEVFIGEPVLVNVSLYTSEPLTAPVTPLKEPLTEDFWAQPDLSVTQRRQRVTEVQGIPFQVTDLREMVAIPLKTGNLKIGGIEIEASIGAPSFFAPRARALRRSSSPVTLQVHELPPSGRPNGDISVGQYALSSTLERSSVVTGEAVSFRVTMQGSGNLQAIELRLPDIEGLRVLDPTEQHDIQIQNGQLVGNKTVEWLLIPDHAGEFTIPSITVHTFDPQTEQYGTITTAPAILTAAGKTITTATTKTDNNSVSSSVKLTYPPIHTTSELRRTHARATFTPTIWALIATPILLWLAVQVFVRTRRKSTSSSGLSQAITEIETRALREVTPDSLRELYGAVHNALEIKVGEATRGATQTQLRKTPTGAGLTDSLTDRILVELERYEHAQFLADSTSTSTSSNVYDIARTIASELEP